MGYLSDRLYGKRSPVAFTAIIIASALAFSLAFHLRSLSVISLQGIMFAFGMVVSGLNNIISASCSADIGRNEVL